MKKSDDQNLAMNGGTPAVSQPIPQMYPGGMRIGEEEEQAVLEVIRSKRLFCYYGPNPGPSQVAALEQAFSTFMNTQYGVAVNLGHGGADVRPGWAGDWPG